ncbi:MAG: arylsulfatase A-like enzyme [Planctomycetota bacterium]|jgi:arylsulfatase A-like enzyme
MTSVTLSAPSTDRLLKIHTLPLLLLASLAACSEPELDTRPNVVLIVIDTLRADKLSSYGFERDTSPALTRLSERGVQFDSVISQSSWTLPSIGSMLTSQYPRTLGLYAEDAQKLPDSAVTLAEVLKSGGYATFGITANPNLNIRYNFQQGFDEYHESVVVFHRPGEDVPEGKLDYKKTALRTTPDIARAIIKFANKVGDARPAFVQVDLMEVHEYFNGKLRRDEYAEFFSDDPSAAYLQMIRQVTDDLEVLVTQLSSIEGWADTLFIFTSDHGEGLKDHPSVKPSRGHGSLLYKSHVSVPWIMYNPSWTPKNAHIQQRVRLLDLFPTILDYVGVASPPGVKGVSLMPLVNGEVTEVAMPEFLMTETSFREFSKVSVIGDEWQFVENRKPHPGLSDSELQEWEQTSNGKRTNRIGANGDEALRMQKYIQAWEAAHPFGEPTLIEEELDDATRAQLEAVGYLGGDDANDE